MADEVEEKEEKPISIAEALKEGVKSATSTAAATISDLDGASKSAVVLLAVGPEAAADVLRLLSPFEVQKLSSKMAVVRALSRDLVIEVLRQFKDATANNAQVAFDTDSFMQNMLHKALGSEGASDLLGKLESAIDMSGVEALKRMEPDVLYEMIKNEHPQIIATVMVFLEPQHAAATAKLFPDDIRDELMLRVALLQKVQPAALKELNEVMSRAMEGQSDTRRSTVGGVTPTAEILNFMSGGMDKRRSPKLQSTTKNSPNLFWSKCLPSKTLPRSTIVHCRRCCSRFRRICWSWHSRAAAPGSKRSFSRTWPAVLPRQPKKISRPVVQ